LCLCAIVKRPREQIADAEALLDLATSSATSVRSQSVLGITPSDFVAGPLKKFGKQRGPDDERACLDWVRVGCAASHVFMKMLLDVPPCNLNPLFFKFTFDGCNFQGLENIVSVLTGLAL
jgi:hypothetical protein